MFCVVLYLKSQSPTLNSQPKFVNGFNGIWGVTKKTGVAWEKTQQLKQKGTHGPTTFIHLDDTTEKVGVGKEGSCFNNIFGGAAAV